MPPKDELTEGEMEVVTMVFKQYETGLREACIEAKGNKIMCSCDGNAWQNLLLTLLLAPRHALPPRIEE